MSRLIIKNLPSYVTPARLKDHFSQKNGPGGTLTDVKVAQKADGTSRRFAFVGYKSDAEAEKAQKWFDRTYIDTTRISVLVAEKGAKDAPAPRPNKKVRLGPSPAEGHAGPSSQLREMGIVKDEMVNGITTSSKRKKETELEEFMQVMQPRTKNRAWANDDAVPELSTGVINRTEFDRVSQPPEARVDDKPEQDAVEELDDLEWMKRRMTTNIDDADVKVFVQDDEGTCTINESNPPAQSAETNSPPENESSPTEIIAQSGRLFLRNLSYSCTQSDLEVHFSPYGSISELHMPLDHTTKSSKGIAFITFIDPACAVKAYEELDKTSVQGRLLHILPAVDRKRSGVNGVEEISGNSTLKGAKEKKRKENAGKEFNWSMLYMNADAVASSIADRMSIPKADILNPESSDLDSVSAAVKLALSETHIIQETKTYLESEGIDLMSFSTLESNDRSVRMRRSDTCILVKNIPYGTTATQIRDLFDQQGELRCVLVPPAGTIAVVDFLYPDEAAKAFKAIAYRRLGNSVVYLEKAPIGIFNGPPAKNDREASLGAKAERVAISGKGVVISKAEDEAEAAPGSTLFVKNLSFATTSDRLTSVFRHLPSFSFARVQTKPDPKHPVVQGQLAPRLSMGFGFVGFTTPDAAKKALRSMQGFVLDGHTLTVKFAGRGADEEKTETKGKDTANSKTTKMIVKNLPFEATKNDLRSLFGAHGQLKSARLPKKLGARTRGFAFLDFTSRHEAENAYVALRHTHLLGRHLVLQWAEDSAHDIDALRKKAGVGYGDGAELPGRKRKLDLREDDDDGQEY